MMARKLVAEERSFIDQQVRDKGKFLRVALQEDDFRAIIICQTYVETLVQRLYQRQLHVQDIYNPTGFANHLMLAVSLGEIEDAARVPLQQIADIRNVLAHQLGGSVKATEIKPVTKSLKKVPLMRDMYPGALKVIQDRSMLSNITDSGKEIRALLLTAYFYCLLRYQDEQPVHPALVPKLSGNQKTFLQDLLSFGAGAYVGAPLSPNLSDG